MISLGIFSLILGLIVAYLLDILTKRLLLTYKLPWSSIPLYYILLPILAFILGLNFAPVKHLSSLLDYCLGYSFLCLLTLTAVMDYYTLEVRHRFIFLVGLLGILQHSLTGSPTLFEMLVGFFAASLPLLLISILTQGSIGGGDIKLLASCGLMLGYSNVLLGTFLAIVIGGVYGIFLLTLGRKHKKDALPFVPFLAIGLGLSYLWGTSIISWYFSLF